MFHVRFRRYGARVNFPQTHFVATLEDARALITGQRDEGADAQAD
jgi:hypothetical protein